MERLLLASAEGNACVYHIPIQISVVIHTRIITVMFCCSYCAALLRLLALFHKDHTKSNPLMIYWILFTFASAFMRAIDIHNHQQIHLAKLQHLYKHTYYNQTKNTHNTNVLNLFFFPLFASSGGWECHGVWNWPSGFASWDSNFRKHRKGSPCEKQPQLLLGEMTCWLFETKSSFLLLHSSFLLLLMKNFEIPNAFLMLLNIWFALIEYEW